jgi:hypothetical protein
MPKDEDIDDQVRKDWEFTRRAEQLLNKLRTQGTTAGISPPDQPDQPEGEDVPPKQK